MHDHRAKPPRLELPKREPFESALSKLKVAKVPDEAQVGVLAEPRDSLLSELVKKTLDEFETHNFLGVQHIPGCDNVAREVRRLGPQAMIKS